MKEREILRDFREKFAEKSADFAEQLQEFSRQTFLTEIIISSFNNNMLQKWANGKAFNIMASAQFFCNIVYAW